MAPLGNEVWPPPLMPTERLVLREPEARDRDATIELLSSADVNTYLGGPRSRAELEQTVPAVPRRRPGLFVVERRAAMVGIVTLDQRDPARPGHLEPLGLETELGYMFLPQAWGRGYAAEACTAVLGWFAETCPGEPVVLCTQVANEPSVRLAERLGFIELERFSEFGAEQWFGAWGIPKPHRPE